MIQNLLSVQFVKCHSEARLPSMAHIDDAAFDLYAVEPQAVKPGERVKIPLGLKASFSPLLVCMIKDRSGLASRGIYTHGGVIDAGYRGEWAVLASNESYDELWDIVPGDRVAQLLVLPRLSPTMAFVDELSETMRGTGGFGSTDNTLPMPSIVPAAA